MAPKNDQAQALCANCGTELKYADYCYGLQAGVMGGTGFVPTHLDDWLLFCDAGCVVEYLDDEETKTTPEARLPPRLP